MNHGRALLEQYMARYDEACEYLERTGDLEGAAKIIYSEDERREVHESRSQLRK